MANITQNFTLQPGDTLTISANAAQPPQLGPLDPASTASFADDIKGMAVIHDWQFGTGAGRSVRSIADLAKSFDPYSGIARQQVINQEWERYQPFNAANHVFNPSNLALTATVPAGGGLWPGGINSGQMFGKDRFQPNVTGAQAYAFEFMAQFPGTPGMWPAMWFYIADPMATFQDGSEIDIEFFMMQNQNSFDWTGFNHGSGAGSDVFSRQTNEWVWHPGYDFSAAFHKYQIYWTPDMVYKYVDGLLIKQTNFQWKASVPGQMGVNLACGSNVVGPGLKPTNLNQFPAGFLVDHITVWSR